MISPRAVHEISDVIYNPEPLRTSAGDYWLGEIRAILEKRQLYPQPDPDMVEKSLAAMERGEFKTGTELLDEIRSRQPEPTQAEPQCVVEAKRLIADWRTKSVTPNMTVSLEKLLDHVREQASEIERLKRLNGNQEQSIRELLRQRNEPQSEPDDDTVEVRIPVAMDANGNWIATGSDAHPAAEYVKQATWALSGRDETSAQLLVTYVTARIPLPKVTEVVGTLVEVESK